MEQSKHYACINLSCPMMPAADSPLWQDVSLVSLADVVSGKAPALETSFQMFRDDKARRLYLRFSGQDNAIHSNFTMHDEPLYRQDVLEVFIADEGNLTCYKELEVSPYDVTFDGIIRLGPDGSRQLDMSWDIEGWRSLSHFDKDAGLMSSVWSLPYAAFDKAPQKDAAWRFNAFRVDHSQQGLSLQAWQKTGEANFHVPQCFGYLTFQA